MDPRLPAAALLLFAVGFSGCASQSSGSLDLDDLDLGEPVAFETIAKGHDTRYPASRFTGLVLQDPSQWKAFWTKHAGSSKPTPIIDFGTHFAVALLMGTRPTGGYAIATSEILLSDHKYVVLYIETKPCKGCAVTQALTDPFHIAKVERLEPGEPEVTFHAKSV